MLRLRLRAPFIPLILLLIITAAASAEEAPPPDPVARGVAEIQKLEAVVAQRPDSGDLLVSLVESYLTQARLTGDGQYYKQAQRAVDRLAKLRPDSWEALTLDAWVKSGEHRFDEAVKLSRRSLEKSPFNPTSLGILADALVELGDYAEADHELQDLANHRPGPSAYLRVAYFRSLHGDFAGAQELLDLATGGGRPDQDPELAAWLATQRGDLECMRGDEKTAAAAYQTAMHWVNGYANAVGPLARILANQGRLVPSAQLLNDALARRPSADLAGTLEDVERARGRSREAELAGGAVEAMVVLMRANGTSLDRSIARVDADHRRRLPRALQIAREEFKNRPSIQSADVLGWVLYRGSNFKDALIYTQKALALGTPDPMFQAHHGLVLLALGRRPEALTYLQKAQKNGVALDLALRAEVASALQALAGKSAH